MNDKPSKALEEVWEWKEAVYLDVKDMEIDKGLQYILEQSHLLAEKALASHSRLSRSKKV
ncbi:MAG: hypothetical protein JXB88_09900 [Spirochaetales bacterium]|nr:hypothetical protein [Spirochaetales bacterium]